MAARRAREGAYKADAAGLCLLWFEQTEVSAGGAALLTHLHSVRVCARPGRGKAPTHAVQFVRALSDV